MTEDEFKEATQQAVLWVKHPLRGQGIPVASQKISVPREYLRELLVRAGLL